MYFIDPVDTDNINFVYLKRIFVDLFGDEFTGEFTIPQIQTLLEQVYRFEGITNPSNHENQFHALYLIGHTLHKYNNENLQLPNFYDKFYFPNMVSILSSHMVEAKRILNTVMKTSYTEVREKCQDIVDFYLVFFKQDHSTIKNDILNMFINTMFLDSDPQDTTDIREYYESTFRYLLYSYLKVKTANHTDFEINPELIKEEHLISISQRYKIYDEGIRISQIHEMCRGSNTDNRIIQNYNNLKADISTNELQKFYLYSTDKISNNDNRLDLLSTFTDTEGLLEIQRNLPLIYKLLRSIHITSKPNDINQGFRDLIYSTSYEILFLAFFKTTSKEKAANMAENTARKITKSITTGLYVDPITLDHVPINNYHFINQLKQFLELMLRYADK